MATSSTPIAINSEELVPAIDDEEPLSESKNLAHEFRRVSHETGYPEKFLPSIDNLVPLSLKAPNFFKFVSLLSNLNYVHLELPYLEAEPFLANAREDRVEKELCELLGPRKERKRFYSSNQDINDASDIYLKINSQSTLPPAVLNLMQKQSAYYKGILRSLSSRSSSVNAMRQFGNSKSACSRAADTIGPLRGTLLSLTEARNFIGIYYCQEIKHLFLENNQLFLTNLNSFSDLLKVDLRNNLSSVLFSFARLYTRAESSNNERSQNLKNLLKQQNELMKDYLESPKAATKLKIDGLEEMICKHIDDESESPQEQLKSIFSDLTKQYSEIMNKYSVLVDHLNKIVSQRNSTIYDLVEQNLQLLRILNVNKESINSLLKGLDDSTNSLQSLERETCCPRISRSNSSSDNLNKHAFLEELMAKVIDGIETSHRKNMDRAMILDDLCRKDVQEICKKPAEIVQLEAAVKKYKVELEELQCSYEKFQLDGLDISKFLLCAKAPSEFAKTLQNRN